MDDQFKEYESGAICSMHGGEDEMVRAFGGDTWRKESTWNPWHRWNNNNIIKLDLQSSMGKHVWINLANIVKTENPAVGEVVGSCEDGNEHLPRKK